MNLAAWIRSLWAARPPHGATRDANVMMHEGVLRVNVVLTPKQRQIFERTHTFMVRAAQDLRQTLEPVGLEPDVWRVLMRGGVAWTLLQTPGESDHIRLINCMRGERRIHGAKQVTPLHEQFAWPAGHAQAVLRLLWELALVDPARYQAFGLQAYAETLVVALPTLRRTTKPNQEPRRGR